MTVLESAKSIPYLLDQEMKRWILEQLPLPHEALFRRLCTNFIGPVPEEATLEEMKATVRQRVGEWVKAAEFLWRDEACKAELDRILGCLRLQERIEQFSYLEGDERQREAERILHELPPTVDVDAAGVVEGRNLIIKAQWGPIWPLLPLSPKLKAACDLLTDWVLQGTLPVTELTALSMFSGIIQGANWAEFVGQIAKDYPQYGTEEDPQYSAVRLHGLANSIRDCGCRVGRFRIPFWRWHWTDLEIFGRLSESRHSDDKALFANFTPRVDGTAHPIQCEELPLPGYQLDAFRRFTAAPTALWKGWRGVITLPPGIDVKPLGVKAIAECGQKTLILAPGKKEAQEWKGILTAATSLTTDQIGDAEEPAHRDRPILIGTFRTFSTRVGIPYKSLEVYRREGLSKDEARDRFRQDSTIREVVFAEWAKDAGLIVMELPETMPPALVDVLPSIGDRRLLGLARKYGLKCDRNALSAYRAFNRIGPHFPCALLDTPVADQRIHSRKVHVYRFSFNPEAMVAYRNRGLGQEMRLIDRARIEWLRTCIEAHPQGQVYVSDRSKAELGKVRGFLERTTRLDDRIRFGPLSSIGQEWDMVVLLSGPRGRDLESFRELILTHEPDDRRFYLLLEPDDSYSEYCPGDWGLHAGLGWSNHKRVITKEDVESWA